MRMFTTLFFQTGGFSLHPACKALVLGMACTLLLGCERPSEPSATSQPSDGIGQRLGTDVTSQPGRSRAEPRAERPKIVALGDSLTAGFGVSPDASYPAQLQRALDRAGYRYQVINAGVSGDTTAGGVRRIDWVLKSRPHIVIVALGANDGLRGLDLKETRANLEQMLQKLHDAGVTAVLAGMKLPPNYGADYAGRFTTLYGELAKQYHAAYLPFFLEGVAAQPSLNQADGIHPTGEGYRLVVDHLMPVLEPLLEKPPPGRSSRRDDGLGAEQRMAGLEPNHAPTVRRSNGT
ncbi:MAG: arylesterase [Nitrospiraceae bacterium]